MTTAGRFLSGGVLFPNSNGTPSNLNFYEEYSYTGTWNVSGTTTTSTIKLIRIGNTVFVDPGVLVFTLTSSTNFELQLGSALPTRFLPANTLYTNARIVNNSVPSNGGLLVIETNGQMYLFATEAGASFSTGIGALSSTAGNRRVSMFTYSTT